MKEYLRWNSHKIKSLRDYNGIQIHSHLNEHPTI